MALVAVEEAEGKADELQVLLLVVAVEEAAVAVVAAADRDSKCLDSDCQSDETYFHSLLLGKGDRCFIE